MDSKGDKPDETSIKPVSLLLSRFETGGSKPASPAPQTPVFAKPAPPIPAPKPVTTPKPAFKKQPPTPPAARRSFDVSRPTFGRGTDGQEDNDVPRTISPSPHRAGSPPKARPLSMQVTPTDYSDILRTRSPLSRDPSDLRPARLVDRSRGLGSSTIAPQDRTPQKADVVSQSPARRTDRTGEASGTAAVDHAESKPQPIVRQAPPPINRAAKPGLVVADSKPNASSSKPAATLSAQHPPPERRSSPFSTPPDSDQGSPPEAEPPPIPLDSKPSAAINNDPFDSQRAPPNSQRTSTVLRPARISSLTPSRPEHTRRRSRSDNTSFLDDDEIRPKLPPRQDPSTGDKQPPQRISKVPAGRQSLDTPSRPSALSQGFSASSFPPRRDSSQSGVKIQAKPRAQLGRRTSITPPPRAKPEPTFNKTYMKSSPVLADPSPTVASTTASNAASTTAITAQSTWPNSSRANRRPPCHRDGSRTIQTGLDSRLMDACGEYVCTSGTTTRVWHIPTGKMLLSMAHPEGVKVTALAFKPSRDIDKEGQYVWLGTNFGELMEIEVAHRTITAVNDRTHSRREIVKMYRKASEIWTLDNDGKTFVWPPDETGTPNLEHSILNGRASRGVTSAVIVGNKLWLASGKTLRVFQPNTEPNKIAFEVTADPIIVPGVGDITSAAHLPSDQDRIYLGHSDGKISIYSRKSNKYVETLSVSLYKVSCLAGVGDYLWAGFNNGTIMLFDTKTRPWTTKKYWQPHTHPVVTIVADKSSIWKTGRYNVLSLGVDSTIGVWDGMLEDDWIQDDMQRHEKEFCTHKDIKATIMTWNAGASKPADLRHEQRDSNFFRELFGRGDSPDMVVFGFQELVDLEDKKLTAKSFFKTKKQDSYGQEHLSRVYREWRDYLTRCLDDCVPQEEQYVQLHTASLVGLFTCVFIKSALRSRIRDVVGAEVKTGMGGAYGNKGSLIVRFVLDDTAICLANCHLAAGQTQTVHRNQDVQAILGGETLPPGRRADMLSGTYTNGGDGSMVMDHEICILNGDLNYRIDTMTRDTVVQAIKTRNLSKLLERDQLNLSRRKNPDFRLRDFSEAPIDFLPTYKYDVGTDNYDSSDKKRAPAWCDRVLVRGDAAIEQTMYRRHEIRVSDHRPVSAGFKIKVKSRNTAAFEDCRLATEQRFQAAKRSVADESQTEYLKSVFGLSEQEARQKLRSR